LIISGALHVIAYFRKQEMRYWWSINVAELASLQKEVLDGLNGESGSIVTGSITTVTALPTAGRSVPRVSLPQIDRIADDDRATLLRHSILLAADTMANRAETLPWWNSLFDDWYPGVDAASDGDPAPIYGLSVLSQTVSVVAEAYGVLDELRDITDCIDRLVESNTLYRQEQRIGHTPQQRTRWVTTTQRDIGRLRALIERRLLGR
jgi:hypothetical protein